MGHFGREPIRLGVVRARAAGAAAQLLRAGRAPHPRPGGDREPVLPHGAGVGAAAGRPHRDARDGDRVAGADLRRVLAHAPGGAARLLPARAASTTRRRANGADLHPVGELGADGRAASASCSASARRATSRRRTASPSRRRWSITTILFYFVARERWGWSAPKAARGRRRLPRRSTSRSSRRNVAQDPARRLVPARHRRSSSSRCSRRGRRGAASSSERMRERTLPRDRVHREPHGAPAAPRDGDGGVHVRRHAAARRPRCCTT